MKNKNRKRKKKNHINKGLKKLNYFNSGLNQLNSDHVFWSKIQPFWAKIRLIQKQKIFEKKENGLKFEQNC